ncbi:MAG TPA: alpha-amylase family glycosyl hydrolase [Actinomycetota bacterium]|nr:alpha-amylase family glycosyl hydrolase [Actinomycetota bacterium]
MLRVALAVTLAVMVGACTGEGSPGATSAGGGEEPAAIAFDVRGGDAYAWARTVSGRSDCGPITLEVNGDAVGAPVEVRDARFRARVPLRPGRNEVVATCEGEEGGQEVSSPLVIDVRLSERPRALIGISVGDGVVELDARGSRPARPGQRITRYVWTPDPAHPADLATASGESFTKASGPRLRLRAPARDGEYYVALEVTDSRGRSDASAIPFVVEGGVARAVDLMQEHPAWIDKSVVYAPIPQLWGNGGPRAVTRRLAYLKRLGVDVLWLWPPTSERAFGEEYAITDYFSIDPSWGPEPDFKAMVEEAHRLGMHVIVDFVPNHMSVESPYFKDAQRHREESAYWKFFDRRRNGRPTHYFDWDHLPNLNYANPEVRRMITEASVHWVRDLGVDGFRVDVAWGVKKRRPGFWLEWRRELKRVKPDLFLLAEASAVDPYYFSNGFDVAYDWTKQLGQWAWASAFEFPQEAGALLAPALTNGGRGYARDALILRFLNNNDTGIRFVDQYSPELTRVAATLQFTVPGIPSLFAGDEIGASYEPYSNLTPIEWRDRYRLRPFYRQLIRLRARVAALTSTDVSVLTASPNSALAYVRPAVDAGGPVLVLLNFGSKAPVEVSGGALDEVVAASGGAMRDLLTGDHVRLDPVGDGVRIAMDAASYLVLVPAER